MILTVCHFVFDFRLKPLFALVDMSKFKGGKVHYRNSGMEELTVLKMLRGKCVYVTNTAFLYEIAFMAMQFGGLAFLRI